MPTSATSSCILPEINFLTVDNLTKKLCLEAKIVVYLSFFGDKAWIRLSANVYNSQEDYVKLKDRLMQFIQKSATISKINGRPEKNHQQAFRAPGITQQNPGLTI